MRTRTRAVTTTAATVLAIAALTAATAHATVGRSTANACTPSWQLATLPEPPGSTVTALSDAEMFSANVLSPRDGLFTGDVLYPPEAVRPWVLRWDGHALSQAAQFTRFPVTASAQAYASSFDSGTDGWALTLPFFSIINVAEISGFWQTGYSVGTVEHWHGGRWILTPTAIPPDPRTTGTELDSVAALSANNAWAVGYFYQAEQGRVAGVPSAGVAVEHWDGTQWSLVANPAEALDGAFLNAVKALSPTDVWAVGAQFLDSGRLVPFTEHYNGTAWSVVPIPPGNQDSQLLAVSAASASDIWAVGDQTLPGSAKLAAPLAEHWDGTAWTVAALPDVGNALLAGVYAASGQVWADGEFAFGLPQLFLHWNGTAWSTVREPGPREYGVQYTYIGMGGSGPGDVWATGRADNYGDQASAAVIAHLSCG